MEVLLIVVATVTGTFLLTWAVLKWLNTRRVTRWLVFAAVGAVLATVFVTLIYANLSPATSAIQQKITPLYGVDDPEFVRAVGTLLGPSLLPGNHVETLVNGDEIFPSMLEAVQSARRTITFETFIYWEGAIGRRFAAALSERARAGVAVHVLLDWLGSTRMEEDLLEQMEHAGVQVRKYHPVRWYTLDRINHRTHRKLLIVDGRIGFTGGVGIGDEWTGNAQDADHWRDNHYRVEGPVVAQMQAAFLDNWMKTSAEVLHGEAYFPELPTTGTMTAQMFKSSAEGGSSSARLMFLLSIASARHSVRIANSYFVPDELAVKTLVEAVRRGVRVEIICPGPLTDTDVTRNASRARWGALLEAGVRIYEFQPTMYHCKYMVIDGLWSSVGSTNFDPRSFRLNDEANLNVLDRRFAAEQERLFEADLARSRRITYKEWKTRPLLMKLRERGASLLGSQL